MSRLHQRLPLRACLFMAVAFTVATPAAGSAQSLEGAEGFYRFPDLHGEMVVFAAEGDLWRVPLPGGLAQRLTSHPADERYPRISPDGRTLAFSAQYEGVTEAYTMPVAGGQPTRLTWEADASVVTNWAPDGGLMYRTTAFATLPKAQMAVFDVSDNSVEQIPLAEASEGTYDDQGESFFFARPAFHNNVTKRYRGGTARDVWRFDGPGQEAVELTGDYDGESHSPMWWSGRVYFVTDRDGTHNIWSMTPDGGDLQQHTRHSGWDVKAPSLDNGRIVYELAGDLMVLDVASGLSSLIPIRLASDLDQLRERWVTEPMDYLTSAHINAEGDKIALTSRGRVFVAPAGPGRLVRASTEPGVRYRDVTFLPGTDELVGLSDATGEFEWVALPEDGVGSGRSLTTDGTILRFAGQPSPDGSKLAYTDQNSDLWILDVASGDQTLVSTNREGSGDPSWSPDSRWLVYGQTALNSFRQLFLYDTDSGSRTALTSDRMNNRSATWGPSGDFLYFLSDRRLVSSVGAPWGTRQPEPYFDRTWEVYEIALRSGVRSPFHAPDELHPENADRDPLDGPIQIELDGIERRVRRLGLDAGNYGMLAAGKNGLFFTNRGSGSGTDLQGVAFDHELEVATLVEGVRSAELSGNGEKILVRRGNAFHVVNARPSSAGNLGDSQVDLSGWSYSLDVREDWRQIFVDAWRMERDYFYDPGMHGVDWEGVRDKYLPLVDRVTTRDELSDVIGRVVGELSALHTSVRGGDQRSAPDQVRVASLGARLEKAPNEGGYRVDYIYQTDPDFPHEMGPLADPMLGVETGAIIEMVNGRSVLDVPHIGALLRNQAGKQVRLRIRDSVGAAPRDVLVTPTGDERGLRYSDWEYTRRLAVDEASDNQIGYVHLRAMGGGNITEWYRNYYPVYNRPGLIIDVRRNSGGNIDAFILEKLMRETWMWWQGRVGEPAPNMHYAPQGHMVVLVDQNTASDGEAFAEGFRRLGLGKVIGMRTWGGEIWLSGVNRLTDGGVARAPMTGVYSADGSEWLIEQIGVIPDMEVDNLPHATFNGEDAQLEAAIEYLLGEIARDPRTAPAAPPYPNLRFPYPGEGSGSGNGDTGGGPSGRNR